MAVDKDKALCALKKLVSNDAKLFGVELFAYTDELPSVAQYRLVSLSTASDAWIHVRDMVHCRTNEMFEGARASVELPQTLEEGELRLLPAENSKPALECFAYEEEKTTPYNSKEAGKIAGFLFRMTLNRDKFDDKLPEPHSYLAFQRTYKNISINKRIIDSIVLKMNQDPESERYGRTADGDFDLLDMRTSITIENRLDAFCFDNHVMLTSDKMLDPEKKQEIIERQAYEAIARIKQLNVLPGDCDIDSLVDRDLHPRLASLPNNAFFSTWNDRSARAMYLSNARLKSSDYSRLFNSSGKIEITSKSKMSLFVKMLGDSLLKSQLTNNSYDVARREPYLFVD